MNLALPTPTGPDFLVVAVVVLAVGLGMALGWGVE